VLHLFGLHFSGDGSGHLHMYVSHFRMEEIGAEAERIPLFEAVPRLSFVSNPPKY
jgi:hypothetical protein